MDAAGSIRAGVERQNAAFCARNLPCIRFLLFLLPFLCWAAIIDRIVVIVGKQVITETELELTIRLTAFLNQEPVDLSPENKRKTVERLIEQKIVLQELDFSKFPRPSPEEVEQRLRNVISLRFGNDPKAYAGSVQKYGLTEADLRRYLQWQMTFFRFIDFRFRPGIQITEAEIEEYFKSRILPLAQKATPGRTITLDEYRERIERILMARREEVEMQGWLADARKRTRIEFRDETLKPQPPTEATKK